MNNNSTISFNTSSCWNFLQTVSHWLVDLGVDQRPCLLWILLLFSWFCTRTFPLFLWHWHFWRDQKNWYRMFCSLHLSDLFSLESFTLLFKPFFLVNQKGCRLELWFELSIFNNNTALVMLCAEFCIQYQVDSVWETLSLIPPEGPDSQMCPLKVENVLPFPVSSVLHQLSTPS